MELLGRLEGRAKTQQVVVGSCRLSPSIWHPPSINLVPSLVWKPFFFKNKEKKTLWVLLYTALVCRLARPYVQHLFVLTKCIVTGADQCVQTSWLSSFSLFLSPCSFSGARLGIHSTSPTPKAHHQIEKRVVFSSIGMCVCTAAVRWWQVVVRGSKSFFFGCVCRPLSLLWLSLYNTMSISCCHQGRTRPSPQLPTKSSWWIIESFYGRHDRRDRFRCLI